MKMNAPIKLEMKVYAVNKDGQQAIVTMSLPLGQYPTRSTLEKIFKDAEGHLPDDFRVMKKSEFLTHTFKKSTGQLKNSLHLVLVNLLMMLLKWMNRELRDE
ncbi:hypothetical protein [Acinetobacter nosocomialis]|uniref:hypothetical protein n=1 Tax=Acinetobacter nosocomialis TaxID=106654 RepID=UPI0024DE9DF4|nr:hypothetical protein [Acinetobacter nosocomialis]